METTECLVINRVCPYCRSSRWTREVKRPNTKYNAKCLNCLKHFYIKDLKYFGKHEHKTEFPWIMPNNEAYVGKHERR